MANRPGWRSRVKSARQMRLVGPVVVLRTFRTDDGELDLEKQRRHLRWLIDQGITEGNGVIMGAGGASEGAFMNVDQWRAIVDLVAEECGGRVPSMAGVFDRSADESAKKARYCEEIGIDFIQLAPPHYMAPIEDEVYYHYKAVSDEADVGLLCYNTTWAMPAPGFEFGFSLLDRLVELDNVDGVCWSSDHLAHYVGVALEYSGRLSFINNTPQALSLPIKLGMTGFFQPEGNVAPRIVLHQWRLWREKRYEEYDEHMLRYYVRPVLKARRSGGAEWKSMGEGPHARAVMEAMGLRLGPPFQAQQPVPEERMEGYRKLYEVSGIAEWVDWED